MVIRAAVITGTEESNKTMAELYKYTYANSIHIPSPHRLLRLCTGKKCEFCLCALGRDSKFVHHWSFACFACWDCTTGSSNSLQSRGRSTLAHSLSRCWNAKTLRYKRNSDRYDAVIHHPRNAISKFSPEEWVRYGRQIDKCYVWREHRSVATYGGGTEKIGPLISWDDIDGIVSYMGRANSYDECNQKIDEYLEDVLDVPTVEEYREFNHAYSTAKKELQNRMAKLRYIDIDYTRYTYGGGNNNTEKMS